MLTSLPRSILASSLETVEPISRVLGAREYAFMGLSRHVTVLPFSHELLRFDPCALGTTRHQLRREELREPSHPRLLINILISFCVRKHCHHVPNLADGPHTTNPPLQGVTYS